MKKIICVVFALSILLVGCGSGSKTSLKDNTLYVTDNEEYHYRNDMVLPVEEDMSSIDYLYKYDSKASDFVNGYPVTQQNLADDIKWFIESYKDDYNGELAYKDEGRLLYTILYETNGKVYAIDADLVFDGSSHFPINETYEDKFVDELRKSLDILVEQYNDADKAKIQELESIRELVESDNSVEREERNLVKKIEAKK